MDDDKKQGRYKWICYIALILFVAVFQTTVLERIVILGASPQLLIYAVSVIAMREGATGGAGAGLVAGLLMDAMCAPAEGFYTIAFVVCAIVVSFLTTVTYSKTYPVSLLLWIAAVVVSFILYYVFFVLIMSEGSPRVILYILPGEIVASVLFTPIVYYILNKIFIKFDLYRE